jgi:hypothetical protein
MSIAKLTDDQVRNRIMDVKDDKSQLAALATQITEQGRYSVALFDYPGGVRVKALDGSGKPKIDEMCDLPTDSDDMFTIAGKRRFIRPVKERLQKLLVDNTPGAA